MVMGGDSFLGINFDFIIFVSNDEVYWIQSISVGVLLSDLICKKIRSTKVENPNPIEYSEKTTSLSWQNY